jgi:hypothetical protein
MKRAIAAALALVLGTVLFATPALSWEKGTHLYIADKLKRGGGMNPLNADEMYGAMAPDIFNYVFTLPIDQYGFLYDRTHHYYYNIWKTVKWGYEKPLAFGFVSHNDSWGADFTAHHQALTTGFDEGYIITKATMLSAAIDWDALQFAIGSPDPISLDVRIELCHNIVEAAGDIVLKKSYPQLGRNLVAAGARSDKRFKNLFLKAYLPDFMAAFSLDEAAASAILLTGEAAFRTYQVVMYGNLLQMDEPSVIAGIADSFNGMVGGYLVSRGVISDASALPDLTPVILGALNGAIALIQNDYMNEVDATVNAVRAQMKRRGFWGSAKKGDIS